MRCLLFAVALLAGSDPAVAQDAKPATLTVVFRGMATEEDAAAVRKAVATIEGIKIQTDDIQPGEKGIFGHYFSPPVTLEIADVGKTDLGEIAKVVAGVKTAERKDVPPPSLNLVLFNPDLAVTSDRVRALRAALAEVAGQEGQKPGGIGGVPEERRYWVRLDDTGAARLENILAALKKADIDMKLTAK
ncbi:MAG TPA: hypothetical protein VM529_18245 [Gemmata sp.]|nr:hypothetical protein [Gemmata sp.]